MRYRDCFSLFFPSPPYLYFILLSLLKLGKKKSSTLNQNPVSNTGFGVMNPKVQRD
jgi:hypothetical protein